MTTTHSIDAARLKFGTWCHLTQKTSGQGDVAASYSADRIGMNEPLRKPFNWKSSFWVCTSLNDASAEVYRLSHPHAFNGQPVSYREKVINRDPLLRDPDGFYHGMKVKHGSKDFVLTGPEVHLVAGEAAQMDLFGGQP